MIALNGIALANLTANTTLATTFNIGTAAAWTGGGTLQQTGSGTTTFNVNTWGKTGNAIGGTGTNTFNIATTSGQLNNITAAIALSTTGAGTGSADLDDQNFSISTARNYDLGQSGASLDASTPFAGGFAGVNWSSSITTVRLDSPTNTSNATGNRFYVTPSTTATFTVNGNLSALNPLALDTDYLSVNFTGVTNEKLATPAPAAPTQIGTDTWTFGNRKSITFNGINQSNGTGVIVVAPAGSSYSLASKPIVQVYDSLSGVLDFQFQVNGLPANYVGGIKVSDVTVNGTQFIAVAPGKGVAGTIWLYSLAQFAAVVPGTTTVVTNINALGSVTPFAGNLYGATVSLGNIENARANSTDMVVGEALGGSVVDVYHLTQAAGNPTAPITITKIDQFSPYGTFVGGVTSTIYDVNGDGYGDVITAPQAGMIPTVNIYSGASVKTGTASPTLLATFNGDPAAPNLPAASR